MNIEARNKLEMFFSNYNKHKYKPKELLIRADEEPTGVYYLTDGIVRMYAVSSQGEEVVINVYRAISFFPMAWILNDLVSHYYFEAVTPVTVTKAPKEEFLKFLKSEPEVLFDLLQRIYKGLDGYFLRMEYLMSGTAQARLIAEILIYAKRFGSEEKGKIIVGVKLTEKDLASQTGIARETVSREIHKLKDKGLVDFDKNILTVKSLVGLEDELMAL